MFEGIDNIFVWAQIIGFFAMIINVLVQQFKNPRYTIMAYIPSSFLWGAQYLMLNAPIGALLHFGSAGKDFGVSFLSYKFLPYILGVFIIFVWTLGLYFYESWVDLLPLIATTVLNASFYQRDNRPLIARSTIFSNICWIIYTTTVGSWMGLLCAILMMSSSIIGMYRHENWNLSRSPKQLLKLLIIMPPIPSKEVA